MSEQLTEQMQAYAKWRQMEDMKANIAASRRFAQMLQQDAKLHIEQNTDKAPIEILALLSIYDAFDNELAQQEHLLAPTTTKPETNVIEDQLRMEFLQQVYRGLDLFQTRIFYQLQVNGVFKRRTRVALPRASVDLLVTWAEQHDHALPTQEEKLYLSTTTGLTVDQISNWFTNAKARKWNNNNNNRKRPAAAEAAQTPKRVAIDDNTPFASLFTAPASAEAPKHAAIEDQSTFDSTFTTEQLLHDVDDLNNILNWQVML